MKVRCGGQKLLVILFCFDRFKFLEKLGCNAAHSEKTKKVRNYHKAVEHISDSPYKVNIHHTAEDDTCANDEGVRLDSLGAEEVL